MNSFPPTLPGYGADDDRDDGDEQSESPDKLSLFSTREKLWSEIKRLRAEVDAKAEMLGGVMDAKVVWDRPILVIAAPISMHDADKIATEWGKRHSTGMLLILPEGGELSTLDDEGLKQCGLKRVSRGPATQVDLYNDMLKGQT